MPLIANTREVADRVEEYKLDSPPIMLKFAISIVETLPGMPTPEKGGSGKSKKSDDGGLRGLAAA